MEERKLRVLVVLSIISGTTLLISNAAATKLIDFFGIAVDGGIMIFPLSYIAADIIIELFDRDGADYIIYCAFAINMIAAIVFMVVGALPAHPEWQNQDAYELILGFTPRITIASLIAFVMSGLTNNYVFEKIKKRGNSKFYQRALRSSFASRLIDSLIFETIAFAGILPHIEFLKQVGFAYIAGCILEIILTPISSQILIRIESYIRGS